MKTENKVLACVDRSHFAVGVAAPDVRQRHGSLAETLAEQDLGSAALGADSGAAAAVGRV